MNNEAEKKEIIEKLITAWLESIPTSAKTVTDWDEEDVKKVFRRKAYEHYGITS